MQSPLNSPAQESDWDDRDLLTTTAPGSYFARNVYAVSFGIADGRLFVFDEQASQLRVMRAPPAGVLVSGE
ncbi:hypothetical protein ACPWT1_08205 [Ramlibacter sp. MMS24-I3-19]|uniref:hypothetical protein n=1 Tax=Ramlibacter sp. MMS24-I3-19 TaxID=3416606 RepID=UPI003CFC0795